MFVRASLFVLLIPSLAAASAMDEVNHWRKANGLPELKEVEWMTEFAQNKAEWRAARLAKNGHQGPRCPGGCREGCGEAAPTWGWLTCCQEESGKYAGAGVAIGADGERYMVLIIKGTQGSAPKGRQIGGRGSALRIINTSKLTPDAPKVERIARSSAPVKSMSSRK